MPLRAAIEDVLHPLASGKASSKRPFDAAPTERPCDLVMPNVGSTVDQGYVGLTLLPGLFDAICRYNRLLQKRIELLKDILGDSAHWELRLIADSILGYVEFDRDEIHNPQWLSVETIARSLRCWAEKEEDVCPRANGPTA